MDVIGYIRKMESAGYTRDQAEAQFVANMELMMAQFATKYDLQRAVTDLKGDMKNLEHRMTIRLSGITIGTVAFFSGFTVFMEHFFK